MKIVIFVVLCSLIIACSPNSSENHNADTGLHQSTIEETLNNEESDRKSSECLEDLTDKDNGKTEDRLMNQLARNLCTLTLDMSRLESITSKDPSEEFRYLVEKSAAGSIDHVHLLLEILGDQYDPVTNRSVSKAAVVSEVQNKLSQMAVENTESFRFILKGEEVWLVRYDRDQFYPAPAELFVDNRIIMDRKLLIEYAISLFKRGRLVDEAGERVRSRNPELHHLYVDLANIYMRQRGVDYYRSTALSLLKEAISLGSNRAAVSLILRELWGDFNSGEVREALSGFSPTLISFEDLKKNYLLRETFEHSVIYARGLGVARDQEYASTLIRTYEGHDRGYCNAKMHDMNCTKNTFTHLNEAVFLLSGIWGDEFIAIGANKLRTLKEIGEEKPLAFSKLQNEVFIDTYAISELRSMGLTEEIDQYDGDYIGARHPLSAIGDEDLPDVAEWVEWKDKFNRRDVLRFGEPSASTGWDFLLEHVEVLDNMMIESLDNPLVNRLLRVRIVFVSGTKYDDQEGPIVPKIQEIEDAERYLESCGIGLQIERLVHVKAKLLGPIDEYDWHIGDDEAPERSREDGVDWRYGMPETSVPTIVIYTGESYERVEENIRGVYMRIFDSKDLHLFGSKGPAIIYDIRDTPTRPRTIAHEIGHLLGLSHSREFYPSLMSYPYSWHNATDDMTMGYYWDYSKEHQYIKVNAGFSFTPSECTQMRNSKLLTHY